MGIHSYRTALVTGAASGIGAACVRMLCDAGITVLAVDKDAERLSQLVSRIGCETCLLDLSRMADIHDRLGGRDFDILINNAGLAHDLTAGFLGATPAQVDEMIAVNVTAAIHVVRAVLPSMIARQSGHVIETGSIAGLYPLGLPVYSATKGAIHAMSRALRMELVGTKVRHTEICPGRTSTGFFQGALPDWAARDAFIDQLRMLDPEDIAAAMAFALNAPLHVNVGLIELTPVGQAPGGQVLDGKQADSGHDV